MPPVKIRSLRPVVLIIAKCMFSPVPHACFYVDAAIINAAGNNDSDHTGRDNGHTFYFSGRCVSVSHKVIVQRLFSGGASGFTGMSVMQSSSQHDIRLRR